MFFISLLNILIKSKLIKHVCNSQYINHNAFRNELVDYKISCSPKKIQKIYLTKNDNIKSISIFGNSRVVIKCSSISQYHNLSLLLFDKPHIKFEKYCNFNTIEIYDSPTIDISSHKSLSVEKLILFNSSYHYSFKPKEVIHRQKITNNKQIKTGEFLAEAHLNVFQCFSQLTFSLSDIVQVSCNYSFQFSLNYSYLPYFRFIDYFDPVIINKEIDYNLNYDNIEAIKQSIIFYGQESFIFSNFVNLSVLDPYITEYKSEESQLLLSANWAEIMNHVICPWVDGEYREKYKYLDSYFNEIESQTNWRKICINGKGYLYYQNNQLKGKVIISTATFFGIIAGIIVIALIICILLYFVAFKLHFNHQPLSTDENTDETNKNSGLILNDEKDD